MLGQRLGVGLECFASPLNTRYDRFCSAFADVDRPFGSLGSFFDFHPSDGSFEANPPFEPQTLLAAVRHAEELLVASERADRALSFAFVVPTWEQLPFHHQLRHSRWLRGRLLTLDAASHAFVDGAQHLKEHQGDCYRVSSFGTTGKSCTRRCREPRRSRVHAFKCPHGARTHAPLARSRRLVRRG